MGCLNININDNIFESEFCKVEYMPQYRFVLIKWKKFCCIDDYRNPCKFALNLLNKYKKSIFVIDATNGFEDDKKDVLWGFEYLLPNMAKTSCKYIIMITQKQNDIADEMNMWTKEFSKYFTIINSNSFDDAIRKSQEFFSFRMAMDCDAENILSLYKSIIGTKGCTWNDNYPGMLEINHDIKDNSLYCMCNINDDIVAVAFAGKCDEIDHLEWKRKMQNHCCLLRIGVHKDYQGKGLATKLLAYILNDVKTRGFDGMRLLVSKTNDYAIKLYDNAGFERCGEVFMFNTDFYFEELAF